MTSETGPQRPSAIAEDSAKASTSAPIADGVRIGHVHLKVADLDRALAFYCGVLGFTLTQRLGDAAAFVSADPDGNGLELYWDRPQAEWPRDADGNLAMFTARLDLDELLSAATR